MNGDQMYLNRADPFKDRSQIGAMSRQMERQNDQIIAVLKSIRSVLYEIKYQMDGGKNL